jgi:16S rRNA (cytosine1402-N4)-methyltransferase
LEDRIVKNTFIEWTTNSIPKEVPTLTDTSLFTLINRKPIIASQEEIGVNRRSRSAKLRGTIKK